MVSGRQARPWLLPGHALSAGEHTIQVDHYENPGGVAVAQVRWE